MNHNQIIEAWNTQADLQNQWGALGEDEKVEFAFSLGAAESKAEIERLKVYEQEAMYMAEKTGCLAADVLADNYLLATSELEAEIERVRGMLAEACPWIPGTPGTVAEYATCGLRKRIEHELAVCLVKENKQ